MYLLVINTMNQVSSKVAVITEDMIVNGDIATQSDLNIFGQVTGSVDCRGDVLVMEALNKWGLPWVVCEDPETVKVWR